MIYYVTNLDRHKNLWDYLHIEKCNVNYKMFNNDIVRADATDEYEDFDMCDVKEQYSLMFIRDLAVLNDLIEAWGYGIIIKKPYDFENIDYMKLVIYDSWNE